jgi:phosphatidylglycerol:prolipoprotein diacylglycerol transferase
MHPILIKLGPITIYSYGFFLAIGFLLGIFYARREAKRVGVDPHKISDLVFYIIIAALVGSRLLYVITEPHEFIENPLEVFKIWRGGLVFYGGFMGAFVTGIWYARRRGLPIWKTADIAAVAIPLGLSLGRIGCFSAGCCYGRETTVPWAVTFTDPNSLARLNVPLHPTQLYEAALDFGIFLFLLSFKKRKAFEGQMIWLYTLLYASVRFFVEIFRGDPRGSVLDNLLSTSQFIGIVLAIVAIVMLLRLGRKKPGIA